MVEEEEGGEVREGSVATVRVQRERKREGERELTLSVWEHRLWE